MTTKDEPKAKAAEPAQVKGYPMRFGAGDPQVGSDVREAKESPAKTEPTDKGKTAA